MTFQETDKEPWFEDWLAHYIECVGGKDNKYIFLNSLPHSVSTSSVSPTAHLPTTIPSTVVSASELTSLTPSLTTSSLNLTTTAAATSSGASFPSSTINETEVTTPTAASTTTTEGVCSYTDWTPWTGCSKSCDVGQTSRSRSLVMENWEMCMICNETTGQREDCNTHPCDEWTPWGQWSDCSVSENCTAGIRTRYRTCSGASCDGDAMDMERCGQWCSKAESNCPPGKRWVSCDDLEISLGEINCHEFSFYESLSQAEGCEGGACVCGEYEHTSSGECVAPASCPCYTENGEEVLLGTNITEGCKTCSCDLKFELFSGIYVPSLECSINASCCDWAEWTSWGSCNVSCGTGSKHRYRDLLSGENCGSSIDVEHCSEACTPDCVVNGTDYYCGNITSENSTHTCYCTAGNGTNCIEKSIEAGECQKYTRTEVIYDKASNCTSQGNVTVEYCSGSCGNSTFQGLLVFDKTVSRLSVNCDCCTGIFSETMEEVTLLCGPTNEERTGYLPKISKCTCSPCSGGATSVTLPATDQYTYPI